MSPEEAIKMKEDSQRESKLYGRQWYRLVYLKSEHWANLRIQRIIISGKKCEVCGSKNYLDVHHKEYKNIYDVTKDDLQVLCRVCHNKEHNPTPKSIKRKKKLEAENSNRNKSLKDKVDLTFSIQRSVYKFTRVAPQGTKKEKRDWAILVVINKLIEQNTLNLGFLEELLLMAKCKKTKKILNSHIMKLT